ncbi:TPA: HAMP domain-containing histidine kinase [Streptococcus suis]|uniref:HAMP domain-containing sensor histidine kinase n=1 Tax=Streptococcus suis TaxID=1307 RepID=UPI001960D17F|nr:HAMP domain-containing sensor histidine kinase [Streptococcus suis]MBM7136869.1 HAMP domain-containing histidine kinase [Streptococcus suis]MBY4600982.1 HAMP domain-containing histidine kinase [Streptococcus suis]MCO8172279.1 HAMP domain-containing histidine kinase [Streptococcus suis]MCO8180662.1 HAMP domain-containing histidine kinase [Streptococcus suis]MCO8190792.1 HAMP domain-containing histidine kinase [Streptococcus suis]
MKLQKRIFRLNMIMLIFSLVAMLGVSVYVVNSIYRNQETWQSTSQKTAGSQQSLEKFSGLDFAVLADELASNDARLYVESNGVAVFSNLKDDADEILGVTVSSTTHTSYVDGEIVISRKLAMDGQVYYLYALLEDLEDQQESQEFQAFLIQLLLVGGIGIVVVVVLNFFFTRRLLDVIMRPLEELHSGVERIQQGDYTVPLTYQGDKEFEELTQGFNQMQTSLLDAREKNRLYEQNRTQMVADISHDLRTPLTSIKGYAKGILDGIANTDEKRNQYLTVIYQKSQVMEKLLEKLFAFSQLQTDKMPFDKVQLDLAIFLQSYVREKTEELVDEDIRFSLEVSDGLPVEIDPIQFRRILDNLVDNARKYAAVKPLIISITGQMQEQEVVWTFTDNGKGVAKDRLDLIFEEFYREDDTRQQVEGHGLGLAIVKNIMERLDGQVSVEATPGLRFIFRLPRKDMK